jgi:hypothetical protein
MKLHLILAILAFIGCGKEEEKSKAKAEVGDVAFLSANDMMASLTLKTITADDVTGKLNAEIDFWLNEPEDSEPDNCMDKLIENLKVSATSSSLTLVTDMEISDCFKEIMVASMDSPGTTFTSVTANFKISYGVGCDSADLSAYDGMTISDLEEKKGELDKLCVEGSSSYLFNSDLKYNVKADIVYEGTAYKFEMESRIMSAQAEADMTPCTATKKDTLWTYDDGCQSVNRELHIKQTIDGKQDEDEPANTETFAKYVMSGLRSQDDSTAKWFSAGKFDITYGQWKGAINYTAADAAPKWEVSNGTATVNGTHGTAGGSQTLTSNVDTMQERLRQLTARKGFFSVR